MSLAAIVAAAVGGVQPVAAPPREPLLEPALTGPAYTDRFDPLQPEVTTDAGALEAPRDDLDTRTPLADHELAEQRGGFAFQGMEISFGADIRTYLNGELALHTVVNWSGNSATTTQTAFGGLTPAAADQITGGVLTSGGMTLRVGEADVFLANEGQTALIHRTDQGVQNVLVNTASNVEASQIVQATLDITGYGAFADRIATERLGADLGALVGTMGADAMSN